VGFYNLFFAAPTKSLVLRDEFKTVENRPVDQISDGEVSVSGSAWKK